jgi:hypothetical protein
MQAEGHMALLIFLLVVAAVWFTMTLKIIINQLDKTNEHLATIANRLRRENGE